MSLFWKIHLNLTLYKNTITALSKSERNIRNMITYLLPRGTNKNPPFCWIVYSIFIAVPWLPKCMKIDFVCTNGTIIFLFSDLVTLLMHLDLYSFCQITLSTSLVWQNCYFSIEQLKDPQSHGYYQLCTHVAWSSHWWKWWSWGLK